MTGSEFEVGPEFRLQTLLEIGMVDKKEVGFVVLCAPPLSDEGIASRRIEKIKIKSRKVARLT